MDDKPRGLIALICAYMESDDAGADLRATLPLAGRTLVERQARVALAVGAETILLVTDPSDAGIADVVTRLRGEGLAVLAVRDPVEAARAVEADDRLLMIGNGALADEDEVARLLDGEGHAVLTVSDEEHDDRFERIDAEARWAGFAAIDGRLLRNTAPMLAEWDLQSTLLRRAVQEGARQVRVSPEAAPVTALETADLAAMEARILRGSAGAQRDWVSRYLLAPIEAEATRRLMTRAVPLHLFGGSLALQALAALFLAFGWLWPGLILFLLSTPLTGVGERLVMLAGSDRLGTYLRQALPFGAALVLLTFGSALSSVSGWGAAILAMAAAAFTAALEGERPRRSGRGLFFAEPKGMGWLVLPFAATGHWVIGLGAVAFYAAGSFFVAQRQAHGRPRKD